MVTILSASAKVFLLGGLTLGATACSDAAVAYFTKDNNPDYAHVICYSGGKLFYDGCSAGAIHTSNGMISFTDKDSKHDVEVVGDCFFEHNGICPRRTVKTVTSIDSVVDKLLQP